jgi:putative hydrolases of HD superfamily
MNDTAKFLYEVGVLKRVARSGWWLAGIKEAESVAEHSFRAAILGYVIATMEGLDAERCACICLLHDVREARLTDLHKVAQRYVRLEMVDKQVTSDQLGPLPHDLAAAMQALMADYEANESPEARVCHDADLLECLLQANEYKAQGYPAVQDWIDTCRSKLRTVSARDLAEKCLEIPPASWWEGLKV